MRKLLGEPVSSDSSVAGDVYMQPDAIANEPVPLSSGFETQPYEGQENNHLRCNLKYCPIDLKTIIILTLRFEKIWT